MDRCIGATHLTRPPSPVEMRLGQEPSKAAGMDLRIHPRPWRMAAGGARDRWLDHHAGKEIAVLSTSASG
jgi:hypothetical protein